MIDIEPEVYTLVRNAIKAEYPEAEISGKVLIKPSKFPAISLIEVENVVRDRMRDNETVENGVELMYEAEIFSIADNSKTECKKILGIIDNVMYNINFTKSFSGRVTNINDTSVYRMVARYKATVDKKNNIYRR